MVGVVMCYGFGSGLRVRDGELDMDSVDESTPKGDL